MECSLVAAGHCWSSMDLGVMQEVRVRTRTRVLVRTCACMSVCELCMRVSEEKRDAGLIKSKDISRRVCVCVCVCKNTNTCTQAPVLHVLSHKGW